MTKNTMGTKLPRKLVQKMAIVGEQIKLARLRRNLSMAQVAERAPCSEVTLNKVEKGLPTVSMASTCVCSMPCSSMMTYCSLPRKTSWAGRLATSLVRQRNLSKE